LKRQTKANKRAFIEKPADEAETTAQNHNFAALYNITKTLASGFGNNEVPVKAVYGNALIGVAEQTQTKEAPTNLSAIPVSVEDMMNNTDPPSAVEVKIAVSSMKSGKAPGTDGMSADMVKGGGEIVVRTLKGIFEGIWEAE